MGGSSFLKQLIAPGICNGRGSSERGAGDYSRHAECNSAIPAFAQKLRQGRRQIANLRYELSAPCARTVYRRNTEGRTENGLAKLQGGKKITEVLTVVAGPTNLKIPDETASH